MDTIHRFNYLKSLQAAAVLLQLDGNRMERIRLLKLLYITDRELLIQRGRTLTGDHAVAMNHGPVLSHVYDLIKGQSARAGDWQRHIRADGHAVMLLEDPGRGELSRSEIEKLSEVTERYRQTDDWTLSISITHEFREWKDAYLENTARPISWDTVLAGLDHAELAKLSRTDAEDRAIVDALFEAVT